MSMIGTSSGVLDLRFLAAGHGIAKADAVTVNFHGDLGGEQRVMVLADNRPRVA